MIPAFLHDHPRFAVLPAPYFEAATRDVGYVDLALRPAAFLGDQASWTVEIAGKRFAGSGRTKVEAFLQVRDWPRANLYDARHHLAATFAVVPQRQRFTAQYWRGPFTREASRRWGDDGASMVLIQRHYPMRFAGPPVLFVAGDVNYQRIDNLVRYFRTHGVNALGFKPDFDRDPRESLEAMGRRDLPAVRQWLALSADGRPAHALGLCLGGLHLRAMANASREPFLTLTTVGTPNRGSELADAYNGLHLGHRFKDARADVARFNALPQSGLPVRSVVLQASHALDVRYMLTAPLQQALHGAETHAWPWQVPTDGLLLAEDQALGQPAAVWDTDHAGMINEGHAASYFDAYAAYEALLAGLK